MRSCNPRPATTIRNQLFLNHVHNQAGFGKLITNGRGFIYLEISKMVFTLGKLKRLIFEYTHIIQVARSQMIKTLNLNVSDTKRAVAPKQRPDTFLSIGGHIQVTPTFKHTWAIPRQTVIGGSQKFKEWYRFLRVHEHSICNI